jgi:hypothetical protein
LRTHSFLSFNNAPKTSLEPIIRVRRGRLHVIRIPMVDNDNDQVRCRWGLTEDECGGICASKGILKAFPCELTYNASKLGYEAVAVVIEDFDAENRTLSAVPLQFLIEIYNQSNCSLPQIIGDRPSGVCIAVSSNMTITERIVAQALCHEGPTNISDIITVSPPGLTKGAITLDPSGNATYFMNIQWTPRPDQQGAHTLCMIPVDSDRRTGQQVCYTFQVDMYQPRFLNQSATPSGIVSQNQSTWSIETDQDMVVPNRSDISIRFFRREANGIDTQLLVIDAATQVTYEPRKLTFSSGTTVWEEVSKNSSERANR